MCMAAPITPQAAANLPSSTPVGVASPTAPARGVVPIVGKNNPVSVSLQTIMDARNNASQSGVNVSPAKSAEQVKGPPQSGGGQQKQKVQSSSDSLVTGKGQRGLLT